MTARTPTLEDFEKIAWEVFRQLPEEFRSRCGDLAIRIEDFAQADALQALGLSSPYELLGLYHGVDLARKSNFDIPGGPDMVFLYRKPILGFQRQDGDPLEDVIAHVLIHEIGHHFGLSDADMEAIEAGAGPDSD
ncbi:metallopeptidase family protein [Methyloligella sp. 2.7D]|uniref:metallopeptidase family protein n=1 Tax=unclassified Methyloligella TaxID=2625955 RepID=UPI00157CEAD4|nr:metallopeptidase family protein [Methyloligella sp. GL2]QKP76409.1 metallopeptidase family protein [Methyloligella sp. GL2]